MRRALPRVVRQDGRWKILPILDWSSRDVHACLRARDLPRHPPFDAGYATVGDWHSSRPRSADDEHEGDMRFGGLNQERGLPVDYAETDPAIR